MEWDRSRPWYHGSPERLTALRAGSTITQDIGLARVFSHKPSIVSIDDAPPKYLHDGLRPGFLYQIAEDVLAGDVTPHPRSTMAPGAEWITSRPLRVALLAATRVREEEHLTQSMIEQFTARRAPRHGEPGNGRHMSHQEGVVKFQLRYTPAAPVDLSACPELNAWRRIMFLTRLIGQDPARYDGYGYGNISQRVGPWDAQPAQRRFIISGTQTGGLTELTGEHYAMVTECRPEANTIVAEGAIKPSAESLTHGTLYALDESVRVVMHAHSPDIWRCATLLKLPSTRAEVPYGTPEMAEEVCRLFQESDVAARGIFAMAGHEDGVISFADSAERAGTILLSYLARSFAMRL
jgi:hypothetical protein